MSKRLMLASCLVMILAGSALAVDVGEVDVTLEAKYMSRYMWRGFDVFDDNMMYTVDLNHPATGLGVNFWAAYPMNSGSVNDTEHDYTVYWDYVLFEEEPYALETTLNYIYYDYTDQPSDPNDVQEVGFGVAMPNLLPIGESFLVPSYYVGYLWPRSGKGTQWDGYFHTLALSYDLPVPALLPEQEEQAISLYADINYNDHMGIGESDWTHSILAASTTFDVWSNDAIDVTVTPELNYQWEIDDVDGWIDTPSKLFGGVGVAVAF